MISLVVVSHSRALARAACALAQEMVHGADRPRIEVAAGLDEEVSGTDATAIRAAIRRADQASAGQGVLVLLDLGSALLSAETALELLDAEVAGRVRLSAAPLVEGLVAAVAAAGAGADLESCCREAAAGLSAKAQHLAGDDAAQQGPAEAGEIGAKRPGPVEADDVDEAPGALWDSVELPVRGEHGVHARPGARLVALAGRMSPGTEVRLRNLTTSTEPVDALSLSGVATLGALQGHVLLAEARGPRAQEALEELRRLAAFAFGDQPGPREPFEDSRPSVPPAVSTQPGVAGSGLDAAIGPVILGDRTLETGAVPAGEPEDEERRLDAALAEAHRRLRELEERASTHLGSGEAEVFAAHAMLLKDPELRRDVRRRIRAGESAAAAWDAAVKAVAVQFRELPDSYQRERAQDVRSVGDRVSRILLRATEPEDLGQGVLVVDELDPALAISLDADAVVGVVTRRGGGLGHGVLIARARGVPVLTGAGSRVSEVVEGTEIAFDERGGRIALDPPPEVRTAFEAMLERRRVVRERALADTHLPATTIDGVRVTVKANVSSVSVARMGAGLGAEGSGLVRTEAMFAQWHRPPSVAQQVEAYAAIAAAYHPHPVTIRTWDVGGDKPLRFVSSRPERNPFLGERGIRAFREEPALLLDQLEAICRVAVEHRVTVLFPMVTSVADIDWARARLAEASVRAGMNGLPRRLGVGIMVEVPAVALRLGRLARGLDMISIGSNDLSQYTLAAERGNPRLTPWNDPLDPAVLQLIRYICDRAPESVVVSLCGEMAADPDIAPLLVGLGVRELSVSAASVPTVKARLRSASLAALRDLAAGALAARDAAAVRELLTRT